MTLSARLQSVIRQPHQAIEALSFSQSLVSGNVSHSRYIQMLTQMLAIHERLETLLATNAPASPVYRPTMARTADLVADLNYWGGAPEGPLFDATVAFVESLNHWSEDAPAALLGVLYVLEGSRMGSLLLARSLAAGFNVPPLLGHGLDYHVRDMAQRVPQWKQFKAMLDTLPLTPLEEENALTGAGQTFQALLAIYEELSAPVESVAGNPVNDELVAIQ